MAEDQAQKTEQPTPRRKQKARDEGQVASSRELTSALQFAAAVMLLSVFGGRVAEGVERAMRGLFAEDFRESISVERMRALVFELASGPLAFAGVFGAALLGIGFLMHLAQTGFLISVKRLQPDVSRLNPGPKLRQLPGDNLAQLFKALLLVPIVGVVFWLLLDSELPRLLALPRLPVDAGGAEVVEVLLELLSKAAIVLLVLGSYDFYRQRRKTHKKLMMTKQDVKQEQKDLEGNPQVKARMRRLQRDMLRRRMMSQVPQATVVVTNPTHYAVALKYDPETMASPAVVAKGLDYLALRIRETAEKHGIPMVENPPLAQALYQSTEVGGEVPENLYRAVAEILAHIFRLTREAR